MNNAIHPVPETQGTVLFVDDDRHLLEMIVPLMGRLSGGGWRVLTATSAGQALRLLQEQTVHLVVIDLRMPVMDGLQFLTIVNRRHPTLQKAVLTGHATEAYRTACLAQGAELFLEKPSRPEEWEGLYAGLNELLRWKPVEGFQGVLKKVGLEDILQMECLGRSSSLLEVTGHRAKGRIYIRDGSLVHAAFQTLEGVPAFHQILRLHGGTFQLLPFEDPGKTTIEGSWEFLLMEAAQARDEAVSMPKTAPPPKPGVAVKKAALASQGREQPGRDAPRTGPEPGAELAGGNAGRPVVDQVLICSPRGETLYEWRVKNPDFWVHFLEFVSRKARQLGQELALGGFRRIAIEAEAERITAILAAHQVALVRAHFENPQSPRNRSGADRQAEPRRVGRPATPPAIPPGFVEGIGDWLRGLPDRQDLVAAGVWRSRETLGTRNWSNSLSEEVLGRTWHHLAEVIHVLRTHRLPAATITWSYERGALRSVLRADGLGLGWLTLGDTEPGVANPGDALAQDFLG